eukprot:9092836-Pyramimonas_sp.AAC.1
MLVSWLASKRHPRASAEGAPAAPRVTDLCESEDEQEVIVLGNTLDRNTSATRAGAGSAPSHVNAGQLSPVLECWMCTECAQQVCK